MNEKLWSRKEICEALNISIRTLSRRIDDLGIVSVEETLPNGAAKKYIRDQDFKRLKAIENEKVNTTIKTAGTGSESIVPYEIKLELVNTKLALDATTRENRLKDEIIEQLREDLNQTQERNDKLFDAWMELNQKYQAYLEAAATAPEKKSFWQRLFNR